MDIVQIDHLSYRYPEASRPAIQEISLAIPQGTWTLLHGPTGSGKSTLLKCITGACPDFYGGTIAGSIVVDGRDTRRWTAAERVQSIGFVAQDPESNAVYDVVEREVAFALENLGVAPQDMVWRVAEALEMVGLSALAGHSVATLSGGQRQRLAVASALVHQPGILLLDEPTSQLDPVAADELLDCLERLRDDFGITIVLSEHRLDAVYARVDHVLYLQSGQIAYRGTPREVVSHLREVEPTHIPTLARLFPDTTPSLTVREARARSLERTGRRSPTSRTDADLPQQAEPSGGAEPVEQIEQGSMSLESITVQYQGAREPALDACTAQVPLCRLTAVIGANGSGKTTLLRTLAGLQPVSAGRISFLSPGAPIRRRGLAGRRRSTATEATETMTTGYLPQQPSEVFSQLTVAEELRIGLTLRRLPESEVNERVADALQQFALAGLVDRSPRDVSGGEQVRVALASLWVTRPSLLLLDEPTRGLDAQQKQQLGALLRQLTAANDTTVILVTHDLEFVAEFAHHVLFLHRGQTAMAGHPGHVFARALAFAPPIARALRSTIPSVQCLRDAIEAGWAR